MLNLPPAESLSGQFARAKPYPHLVLPGALRGVTALNDEWPVSGWKTYQGLKRSIQRQADMGPTARRVAKTLVSQGFVAWLSEVTGIPRLLADESMAGGGLHETMEGGQLKMHVDFSELSQSRYRRLNVILFCCQNVATLKNAALTLAANPDTMQGETAIQPHPGTMVVMESSNRSWHGHPYPLVGGSRRSIASYYYTVDMPPDYDGKHSTIYAK